MADRFDRQVMYFGAEGQARIAAATVAVIGLGGLGSHVVQQLAYLGVGSLILVDPDSVELSNLNRLVGATAVDAQQSAAKVDTAERLIQGVDPKVCVVKHRASLTSSAVIDAISDADYIVGCLDHDGPRLLLTTIASAYDRSYIDLATDIDLEEHWYGGRVIFTHQSPGCLVCYGELNQRETRLWTATAGEIAEEDRIYGKSQLGASPSVVSLNGVVASAGVIELQSAITGVRAVNRHLEYHPSGKLTVDRTPPTAPCYYCHDLRTSRDVEVLRRLLRMIPDGR
jgi:threonine dehydrogenase-like Zn-dependent dehydrogenase